MQFLLISTVSMNAGYQAILPDLVNVGHALQSGAQVIPMAPINQECTRDIEDADS